MKKSKRKKLIRNFFLSSGVLFWLIVLSNVTGYKTISIDNILSNFNTEKINNSTLNECVDGDTAWFNIDGSRTKVRFLYVDTPESTNKIEPYGKEASKFTCNLLTNASKIELEYDGEKVDKYGRTLAWVYVTDNSGNKLLVQEELAKNGYVKKFYDYGNYKYEIKIKNAINDKFGIFEK